MKVHYIISSNIKYGKPLGHLIHSMIESGVSRGDITAVVGGASSDDWSLALGPGISGIGIKMCTQNSFDYTGIIEFVKNPWETGDYIFTLHDTMEFTSETDALIKTADPDKWATAVWGGQCNLVLYKRGYLLSQASTILTWENCTKLAAIHYEGVLYRNCPEEHRGVYHGEHKVIGKGHPYDGVERITELYTAIQLKKYKACWGQNMHNLAVTP